MQNSFQTHGSRLVLNCKTVSADLETNRPLGAQSTRLSEMKRVSPNNAVQFH